MTRVTMIAGGHHRDELLVLYNRQVTAALMHELLAGSVITLNPQDFGSPKSSRNVRGAVPHVKMFRELL